MVSGLLLAVGFLALLPLSQAGRVLSVGVSVEDSSYSWGSSWSHSFAFSHGSGSWSWSRTWSGTWTGSWSRTWSWHTHSPPTYVSTEYVPYCDPNNPYSSCYSPLPCNPYDPQSPCYAVPTTVSYYSPPTQTIVVTESPPQTIIVTQTLPSTAQVSDFALSVSPPTVSLPPGNFIGSANFTLNLTSVQGWSGDVDFTTSPMPTGVTFSNFPPQFLFTSPIASWDVQVNIGPSAQAGTYAILIVASSGSLAHSAYVTVEVA